MLHLTARYDGSVDDGPAHQGPAEAGDVPRRVQVRVQPQPADPTPIVAPRANP
jgi:hypothetical protein